MERRKKAAGGGISVGSSSILVIFVVLALTAFAALSLTTAGSDLRLTRRVARATQEFYAADAQAVELTSELREARAGLRPEQFPAEAQRLGWSVNGMFLERSIPIEGDQTLEITVDYSQTPMRITRWQVVNEADWQEQDSFTLWDGGLDLAAPATEGGFSALPPLPGTAEDEPAAAGADSGALIFTGDPAAAGSHGKE